MTSMFLRVPLILISTLGILFNGYIVTAVLLTRQVSTANNLLLLHLGFIDVLLSLIFIILPGFSKFGGLPCDVHGFLHNLLHPLALWTICGLNCDRYYAIAAPLHYSHIVNAKKVSLGLGVGWLISLVFCIPPLFTTAPYHYVKALEACAPDFAFGAGTLWYSTLYTAFTLLLPVTLIICCNLKILMIARYHRHRIASAIYEVTLSAQVTITHQRNPFFVPTVTAPASGGPKFRGRSAIYSVLQLVGSMAVLYLPYYGLILWEATSGSLGKSSTTIHPNFFTTAMVLLNCSPLINGFLYGIKSKGLRKAFKNYWRKKQTKNEVNNEIQARTPSTCGSRRPSLTPLGFLAKPTIQRRLSEALLDVRKAVGNSPKHKMKRITTELSWRPSSANNLNLFYKEDVKKMKQTTSCNTLQIPNDDIATITEDEAKPQKTPNRLTPASIFHRIFKSQETNEKKNEVVQSILDGTPKHSPRITITRTYSEDSDSSRKSTITKKHSSSSTTLFERKWRLLREGDEGDAPTPSTKPLLDNSSNGSDSSEASEKIYLNLDGKSEPNEDETLLTWPGDVSKSRPILLKQKTIQSHDVVLH